MIVGVSPAQFDALKEVFKGHEDEGGPWPAINNLIEHCRLTGPTPMTWRCVNLRCKHSAEDHSNPAHPHLAPWDGACTVADCQCQRFA
jgi:hypothetical protein